jgi:hypothetical protein
MYFPFFFSMSCCCYMELLLLLPGPSGTLLRDHLGVKRGDWRSLSSTRSLPAVAGGAHRMGCVTLSSLWAVSLCLRFLEVRRKPFNQAKRSPSLCFTVVDWASRLEKGSGNNAQRHCTFQIHHIYLVCPSYAALCRPAYQ